MHRFRGLLLAAFLCLVGHAPAEASADYGCYSSWKLAHPTRSDCDNIAILGPGNDTRVNLTMLLIDIHGPEVVPPIGADRSGGSEEIMLPLFDWRAFKDRLSPGNADADPGTFADGEGSRCRSNVSGIAAFEAAIRAARKVPEAEREILLGVRRAIQPTCAGVTPGAGEIAEMAGAIQSRDGRAFEAYLRGTLAFYDGDYDAAAPHFGALRTAGVPWLKETARYMAGRVELNRAQINAFDEYGYPMGPEHVDQKVVDAAEAAFLAYLRAHPRGLYAHSARGLLRRVYWLGGRTDKLVAEYAAAFGKLESRDGSLADLSEEVDNKFLLGVTDKDVRDPNLLAALDLLRMRACGAGAEEASCRPISLAQLEAQRNLFAANPALFDYLLAAHSFYVADRPEDVLRLIPAGDPGRGGTYLEFSRQMLRRMAFERLGRIRDGDWIELLPAAKLPFQRAAVELALSLHYERAKALDRVFAEGSPIRIPVLRETLLTNVADASLLRKQAKAAGARQHERDVALFTLLYKELSRGAYRDFLADLMLVGPKAQGDSYGYQIIEADTVPVGIFNEQRGSEDFGCPPLKETARRLAAAPQDPKARLCLADFMRLHGFDGNELDRQPPKDELGGTPTLFAAAPYSRLEVYKNVIADPKAQAADKAYALYRAINCYGPTGNNSCGGIEVPVEQRRVWFQRLKKDYPDTLWAKALKYYW